jgi:hypothetical protein
MVWKRLFSRRDETVTPAPPSTEVSGGDRRRQKPASDPAMQSRLDALRRRRDMAVYDLERSESARLQENPWRERMDLLDQSLATIEADLRALESETWPESFPLAETPVTGINVNPREPVSVEFTIGPEHFSWEEEVDWDQRGGPVVRGQVSQRSGSAAALVPAEISPALRDALARHLDASTNVLALDLRDRAVNGEELPQQVTLADLARPCSECGGWRDWRGHCDACATRAFRRQTLQAEATRIAQEREAEEEDRYKWAERLPVARKRLADVESEIAQLEQR